MPAVVANFFTRPELQALILKASGLADATACPAQRTALRRLLAGAVELEGVLAELAPSNHPNDKALANPYGWQSEWVDNSVECGPLNIKFGQQILKTSDTAGAKVVGTDRFRVTLGDAVHVSSDRRRLRGFVVNYMDSLAGVNASTRAFVLDFVFPEAGDALQVESPAA
jgi:hypothetical protein